MPFINPDNLVPGPDIPMDVWAWRYRVLSVCARDGVRAWILILTEPDDPRFTYTYVWGQPLADIEVPDSWETFQRALVEVEREGWRPATMMPSPELAERAGIAL